MITLKELILVDYKEALHLENSESKSIELLKSFLLVHLQALRFLVNAFNNLLNI